MKNIIIGTAGHIDHGKTELIRALTGTDTDRLKEEKERGISIELGFTYFDLPSGRRAGIIDVPGHERFIKNMLAGVAGIDIVILVIAADEGVMPQTKEHLDILNMLNIKKGIVALTKIDLVDDEWLNLVKEDIKEHLKGTFLESSPVIEVSSIKGIGINKLINTIDKLTEEVEERDIKATPRLPIDRVFTISGFGTIVTGTLIEGRIKVGDEVQIFPGNKITRIRSIQVHGNDTDVAYGGQRVAINLAGVKKSDINRGDVVAPVNSMEPTMMLDVKLRLLEDSQRIIENRTRLRLHIGTNEIFCRAVLLDKDMLLPGESCYAQLRLEEKIVAKRKDRFIVRFYSPMVTIGGGEILEPNPNKKKRFDEEAIEELKIKEQGDNKDILEKIVKDNSKDFLNVQELSKLAVMPENQILEIINKLEDRVVKFNLLKDTHIIHKEFYEQLKDEIVNELKKFHKNYPLKSGMLKEEVRSKYLGDVKPKLGDNFINNLIEENIIKQIKENIALKEFEPTFTKKQKDIKEKIEEEYKKARYKPPKKDEVISKLDYDKKEIEHVYEALLDLNILIKAKEGIIFHKEVYEKGIEIVKNFISKNGSITLAEFRDLIGTSRKYAMALLESYDQQKITRRIEDKRILY
ncbi:selenocysteine-specific translation elongation factor [Thermohalobacter berrensis]|uniref:Selenocysteine-specific elongation factor n=1 Tax=Thermohalobacter berrensis TaxID=99594 RepID=A0A419T4K6_9FIRM|nr:selenocysteine-specific translation elongation factor [Thermohalobacter berrensis]RKD32477.1 selenocysteine-specific translation elongation factor [Thermohalobacter berrensis]